MDLTNEEGCLDCFDIKPNPNGSDQVCHSCCRIIKGEVMATDEQIVIPTRGRVGTQLTYDSLPKSMIERYDVRLVCPKEEIKGHKRLGYRTMACPVEGIGNKRQWIMDMAREKGLKRITMVDDDVFGWFTRISDAAFNLRRATDSEIELAFKRLFRLCEITWSITGISKRSGNNRFFPKRLVTCIRQNVVHCIDVDTFHEIKARFDHLLCMEDFDVLLHFLKHGYKNAVITSFAWDTKNVLEGGCSLYRDNDVQTYTAHKLAKLHKGFVRIVEKSTKSAWRGLENEKGDKEQKRTDVIVYWKKAYRSSRESERRTN